MACSNDNHSHVIENQTCNGSDSEKQPEWNYVPILSSIITIVGMLTNGTVLFVIVKNRSTLITPFNIYLVNLLIGNILNLFLFFPLNVIHLAYGDYWWLGNSACTLFVYGFVVLNATLGHGHLLITINRFWAVTFPISYRNRHRQSVAVLMCLCMWLYLHVTLLPGVIMDALYHRSPVETSGCSLNIAAQFQWVEFVQIQIFDLPVVLIAINYVWIAYRRIRRFLDKSSKSNQIQPSGGLSNNDKRVAVLATNQLQPTSVLTKSTTDGAENGVLHPVDPNSVSQPQPNQKQSKFGCRTIPVCGQRFMVLTLMTLLVVVCHTPEQVQDTMWLITETDSGMGGPFTLLMAIPTMVDPILFAMTLNDLRGALLKFFNDDSFFRCIKNSVSKSVSNETAKKNRCCCQ